MEHVEKKMYVVDWVKNYYMTGTVYVNAASADEAKAFVQRNIGNYEGSLQYAADDEITATEYH